MSNNNETRWEQRLDSFGRAVSSLTRACDQGNYSELERAGLIKEFEICFELSWKVLKDLLSYEGCEAKNPREVIRKSFESEYIDEDDCEIFLEILKTRGLFAQIYHEDISLKAETLIRNQYHPMFLRLREALRKKRAV